MLAGLFGSSAPCQALELGLEGGEQIIWVFQTRAEPPERLQRLHLAYLELDREKPALRPLNQGELGGEIIRSAVRGRQLHAFFRDGTHLRFEPQIRRVGGPQAAFPELNLPGGAVPLAVAGDSASGVLYALVPGRVAEAVDLKRDRDFLSDLDTSGAAAEAAPPDAITNGPDGLELRAAATMPATQWAASTRPVTSAYALVRFERGRWHRDAELPAFFDHHAGCSLAADRGVCDLYFAYAAEDDVVWVASCRAEAWSEPARVRAMPIEDLLDCRRKEDRREVLLREGGRLVLLRGSDDGWHESGSIRLDPGASALVGALADGRVAAAWVDEAKAVRAGLWDERGDTVLEAQVVTALQPPPSMRGLRTVREIAPFVVLGLALLYVFVRRRESVMFAAVLPTELRLAGYMRRLAAFVLDLVVVAPAALPVIYGWARHLDPDGDLLVGLRVAMAEHFAELFWRWLLALGLLVAYGMAFEGLRGGTPGKLLMGCRVVTDRGERCGWRAAMGRNLLRLLELFPGFDFAPLLLLVLLTRNRQRLGDLVARTVVVELRPPEERPSES